MSDSPKSISQIEYDQNFQGKDASQADQNGKTAAAYERAEQIRQFEILLYWSRSNYFWAFIGATMAGYGAIRTVPSTPATPQLALIAAAMGFVFSVAWYFVNRGSKQWHENWENHVDLLEDAVTGPLHKTVLRRPKPTGICERLSRPITGPGCYSVSKINQIVSCFVVALWALILGKELLEILQVEFKPMVQWFAYGVMALTAIVCLTIRFMGRTDQVNHHFSATMRSSEIEKPLESPRKKS